MVATIARAATAEYYIHSQASFRPPGEYYLSGEEPDGVWWNPSGLLASGELRAGNGEAVDSADFYKLYNGFDPRTGAKLTQNAGSEKRCPAYDITFNADKTISALWAIAPADLRAGIEKAHNDAVKVALQDVIRANCGYTRIRENRRGMKVVPADIMGALFQHGAARSNDPHLHTHCVILNLARAHHDGKWRALHGHPLFSWQKAAGATYRAELAWLLRDRLGIEMEVHGDERQYTRVRGTPRDLVEEWSKRDIEINDTAARFGVSLQGNGALHGAIQRLTRNAKEHGIDPEHRHDDWTRQASQHIEDIPGFVESVTGRELELTEEDRLGIARELADIPDLLTEHESVFYYTDLVERAANAASGLLSREQRRRTFEKVLEDRNIVELDKPDTGYDAGARLANTRPFTAAHTIETERAIHEIAGELSRSERFAISEETVAARVRALRATDYPIDDEQIAAMRAATRAGQIAIIEGAAGSGKTTTLRPIADLYRAQGHDIIATSVSWRVTLELGTDLDAPCWCVDKLNAGVSNGRIPIGARSVIVVDEAGQLSSLQARKILSMARAARAKVIFAGDTRQQQPVEAGPGLRLVRDVTGSVRVDTIRRQKADVEDILVAIHGEDREAARVRANVAPAREKQKILDAFDALPDAEKARVRPWQVVASERFRDGEAARAIAAYDSRGRFHVDSSLDRTFDRLIGDWDRLRTERPDKTSAVIAYSRAEVRALAHLMRERILAGYDGPRYTVQACRGREANAKPEPLELAVGDMIRTGAANFDKMLFNGTRLEILELREDAPTLAEPDTPRIWIRGRTDRGRIVAFHHDDIRDYHGRIRLDYGYAMTMNAAQGLTVDRAFVFANQKPSRETIYPAMTRHRERLDVYVDRKPVELDVRNRRNEETAGDPVSNAEILEYLARNWSRSRRKEAAQDYMTGHMRDRHIHSGRSAQEVVQQQRANTPDAVVQTPPARRRIDAEGLDAAQWLAANDAGDGKLARIAARIRYGTIRVRRGHAARSLGEACRRLNRSFSEWDEARREAGNAAVARDPRFRRDLGEAAAILKTARPFLRGDPLHARLLREHGGIGVSDIRALESARKRARSIRDMSRGDRRRLDPEFTAATLPKTRESAAADEIARAFDAIEPEARILEVDSSIEPPADLWEGWDRRRGDDEMDMGAEFADDEAYGRDVEPPSIDPYPDLDPAEIDRQVPGRGAQLSLTQTDLAADRALSAAQRIAALDASWNRHLDAAVKADRHPFVHPGWTELHREMRDIAALPDIAPQDRKNVLEWIGIADDWLGRYVPGHAARAHEDPASLPGRGETPAATALVDAHRDRLARHIDNAFAAGIHPFDADGWEPLEQELRGFLDLPGLSREDRTRVEEQIAEIDGARRDLAPETGRGRAARIAPLVADNRARIQHHFDNAADAGVHPFEADGWDAIEEELRGFTGLPGISRDDRDYVEDQIAEIDRARHDLAAEAEAGRHRGGERIAAADNPGEDLPARARQQSSRTAEHLYHEHRRRLDAHMQSLQDAHDPSEIDIDAYRKLWNDGLSLLQMPDLPDAARADLSHTHGYARHFETVRLHATRRRELTIRNMNPYRAFDRRFGKHLDAAAARNLHPYAAPGWEKIADNARQILRDDRLTGRQRETLNKLLANYGAWTEARNQVSPPREQDRSQGMSW